MGFGGPGGRDQSAAADSVVREQDRCPLNISWRGAAGIFGRCSVCSEQSLTCLTRLSPGRRRYGCNAWSRSVFGYSVARISRAIHRGQWGGGIQQDGDREADILRDASNDVQNFLIKARCQIFPIASEDGHSKALILAGGMLPCGMPS